MTEPLALREQLRSIAAGVASDEDARAVIAQLRTVAQKQRAKDWRPYVWQRPHVHPPGWVSTLAPGKDVCDEGCAVLPEAQPRVHGFWLQRGGRGTGKTEGAAHYVDAHVMHGPPCDPRVPGGHRITIAAPTQTDAVSSCVEGVSGLKAINPLVTISTGREGTIVRWPGGSVARLLGAHSLLDVDRARAWSNVCLWWVEEAAAMPRLGGLSREGEPEGMMDQAPYTLRLGANPHMVVTTTPKNRPEVIRLLSRPDRIETWGRTRDAYRLETSVREALDAAYGGTTAGAQELDGELIQDVPGALWVAHRPDDVDGVPNPDQRPGINNDRVEVGAVSWRPHYAEAPPAPAGVPLMERVIVAVDPPGGRTEAGIIVCGTIGRHGYLLADLSLAGPPDTWARIALQAYRDFGAEGVAAEHTYGGDMVTDVLSTRAEQMIAAGELAGPPPIFRVPTKVGKRLRAEPVQGLYQQHRIHHVGYLEGVEAEMRTWVPGVGESPNRVDALVHGFTFLLIRARAGKVANPLSTGRRFPTVQGGSR